ncbi:MAG: hypothetical protein EZS28_028115 [Streblomastix strix]|uniref:Protein kinase domain-containing protein n=1 Tax=Streblomastix strix TaxID=222440 RepID=A0A5J4V173_9EUKA|nr:MAG: hypothetical protein EZS28_028115 [Streblomastix strix]
MINSGIVDSLLKILSTWELDNITQPYIDALTSFTYPSNFEIIQQLIQKKSLPTLLRLFEHEDENIIKRAINAIDNIIYYGAIGTDTTQSHPYYQDLTQIGGIIKIFELFRRTKHEYSKIVSSTCLGIVFRAREMINPEMKVEIINYLKSIITHENYNLRKLAKLALKCLAQNSVTEGAQLKRLLKNAPAELTDLLTHMLSYDPDERYNAHQCLKHPYLQLIERS